MENHTHAAYQATIRAEGAGHHARTHAESHASTRTYLLIAAVLTVITGTEFGILYVPALKPFKGAVTTVLGLLSAAKFVMVVGFFMHLKFDKRLLTFLFVAGFLIAAATVVAVAGAMSGATLVR